MHRPYDGDQDLHFYYISLEEVVRGLFGNVVAKGPGNMHLRFQRDIGPDGKRRFTDCHTCLAFEYASEQIGDGVVQFSLALFIDGTYQLKNVATLPVYITTRNYDKSIQNQPSAWRLVAVIPYYKLNAGTLSPRERTYRRREVSISPPLIHLSPCLVHWAIILLNSCYTTALPFF